MILAAIEAGGTKFLAGLLRVEQGGSSLPEILAERSFPTSSPEETLGRCADFLEAASAERGRVEALGIGCFGPVELRPGSPDWGRITSTPKPGWRNAEVAGYFRRRLGRPVAFDTDVNAAALGELRWGAARGLRDFVYLTVGTGIGGGVLSNGALVHGLSHPELGHLRLAREAGDGFPGACPYHGDCLEGLASGPAIAGRWGRPGPELEEGHPAWELEAAYLARAIAAYALVLSPERVLLGGGVGLRPGLAERVSELLGRELGGYLSSLAEPEARRGFVRRPELGSRAGFFGAAALALGPRAD